jgi:hypothetical protein
LAAGLIASFFSVRCMRSCRPVCCGWPGLMRSMRIPSRSHHTDSLPRSFTLLTAAEVAKALKVSAKTVQRKVADGHPSCTMGRNSDALHRTAGPANCDRETSIRFTARRGASRKLLKFKHSARRYAFCFRDINRGG